MCRQPWLSLLIGAVLSALFLVACEPVYGNMNAPHAAAHPQSAANNNNDNTAIANELIASMFLLGMLSSFSMLSALFTKPGSSIQMSGFYRVLLVIHCSVSTVQTAGLAFKDGFSFIAPEEVVFDSVCNYEYSDVKKAFDKTIPATSAALNIPKPKSSNVTVADSMCLLEHKCSWGKCWPMDGKPATSCCPEHYEFVCCKEVGEAEQTLLKQMEGCKETLNKHCPCGLYNCIHKKGAGRTACCAEHYEFSCCKKPPPPETPTALQLKQNETCAVVAKADCDCGWAKCIRDEGYSATACCAANYKFTCCVTPPTTILPPVLMEQMEQCNKTRAACPCGWGNCIPTVGTGSTPCCASHYEFVCCTEPMVRQWQEIDECVRVRNKCNTRCLPKRGHAANACCSANYKYTCLQPEFVQRDTSSTLEELLTDFQKRKECNGNNSECNCCWRKGSTAAQTKPIQNCRAAHEKAQCYCALIPVSKPDYDPANHFCIKDKTQMASAYCEEGYRFLKPCLNPNPAFIYTNSHLYTEWSEECNAMIKKHCKCPNNFTVHVCELDGTKNLTSRFPAGSIDNVCCYAPYSFKCCPSGPRLLPAGIKDFPADHRFKIERLQPNTRKTDFAWEKPVSEHCKQKVENCSCGHASCLFTGAQKHDIIDICCEEQYEFKCCPDLDDQLRILKNLWTGMSRVRVRERWNMH
uniref:Uncharacterized protein n=1 Tax=Globodera rostochiensis TaxID=31243 RepID=A0A914H790_GLORO